MRLSLIVLAVCLLASSALGQRQRRHVAAPVELPIVAHLTPGTAPHEYALQVIANADVHIATDLRLVHLEVLPTGARRPLSCDAPSRPRRFADAGDTLLASGSEWHRTFDVRTICWGRALTALDAGAELRGTFGVARGRSAAPVAQTAAGEEVRSVPLDALTVAAQPTTRAPVGDVSVSLAPSDAATGARVSLRVSIRSASRAIRAWVRPDRVALRVVSPDGSTHTCVPNRLDAAPIPDLFAHLSTARGPTLTLDARAYCGASVFAHAGIYDVTPILTLDADGRGWRMDTPLGTFEGLSAPVRVRADAVGYR